MKKLFVVLAVAVCSIISSQANAYTVYGGCDTFYLKLKDTTGYLVNQRTSSAFFNQQWSYYAKNLEYSTLSPLLDNVGSKCKSVARNYAKNYCALYKYSSVFNFEVRTTSLIATYTPNDSVMYGRAIASKFVSPITGNCSALKPISQ